MSLKQPVQYPVKYYSHADADAPQLADADGVIKTILKACLVTGYGTKDGAGWTALFEDDYRIVLRRPLQTDNPPDIKIENGMINGSASHRIVSQDDPTGLDDATELAAVNLLARDSKHGQEWHLIVSDFAFIFCYQMSEHGRANEKQSVLYCGSMQKTRDSDTDVFVVSQDSKVGRDGRGGTFLVDFLNQATPPSTQQVSLLDMRSGNAYYDKNFLTIGALPPFPSDYPELHFNDEYAAQKIMISTVAMTPFYCSVFTDVSDITTKNITIDNRAMLRYVNKVERPKYPRVLYIPLDYWEL